MIQSRRRTGALFPAGLYASLLAALLCLVRPDAAERLESVLQGVLVLPFRALVGGGAADDAAALAPAGRQRARLRARWQASGVERPPGIPPEFLGHSVPVLERRASRSGERVDELVLDAPFEALRGAAPFVTAGDCLIGFLGTEPVGPDDPLAGAARVALLHHRPDGGLPRRVPAEVDDGDALLRFLVEPAAAIDRWPLQCALLSDPYRAAGLNAAGQPVTTLRLRDDPLGPLPEGLRIGTLRVYGYEQGGKSLPIGLFVAPAKPTEELNRVVLWKSGGAARAHDRAALPRAPALPVDLLRLPASGGTGERWFVLGAGRLPRGAAVVSGDRMVGLLEVAGRGFGVVAPFGQPGRRWSLVVLPRDERAAPIDVVAVALGRAGSSVTLAVEGDTAVPPGQVFCGAGGAHVPPGLWLGETGGAVRSVFVVEHFEPPARLAVHHAEAAP